MIPSDFLPFYPFIDTADEPRPIGLRPYERMEENIIIFSLSAALSPLPSLDPENINDTTFTTTDYTIIRLQTR